MKEGQKPGSIVTATTSAALLAALLLFNGCVTTEPRGGQQPRRQPPPTTKTQKTSEGPISEQPLKETRQEASQRLGYTEKTQELSPGSNKLESAEVSVGGIVTQTLEYTVLDPDARRRVTVTKTVFIVSEGQPPQLLARVATQEVQGTHVLKARITLPDALDPGVYTILTVLEAGVAKKQVSSKFKVVAARKR